MAFSRTRKRSGEERKCLGKMSSEPSASLGGIVKVCLADESQNQIIDRGDDVARVTNSHASGIFFESEIAAIM